MSFFKEISARRLFWIASLCLALIVPTGWAVGPDQAQKLQDLGVSQGTIDLIVSLEEQPDRARPPVVTADEVERLAQEGVADNSLALLVRLDLATAREKALPVTPAAILALKKEGVHQEIIQRVLEEEINNYNKLKSTDMGRSVVTRSDGSQAIVYQVGDPDKPRPSAQEQEDRDLERALKILERLNIYIKPHREKQPAESGQ